VIAPTRRLCLLALVPLVPTVALFAAPSAWPAVALADLLVVAVAVGDLATLPGRRAIRARRDIQAIATRGATQRVAITLENRSGRGCELDVVDDRPPSLEVTQAIPPVRLPARGRRRVAYTLVPTERGEVRLAHVFIRAGSRLGLWNAFRKLPAADVLHVYPALEQIGRYALYARTNRMSLLGVRRSRRIGTDNEFERLRDYSSDDQFKAIDWRATARRLKLTVRDHQANQSQRIVFAIDCGRMMVNRTAGESLLDAALDAALTLAHVALAQRDEAGILCYDEAVTRWLPPRGGHGQLNRMVAAVHDVEPRLVESRADTALLHLQRHCRKRTLLVVLTHLIDDRNAERIKRHLAPTVGRHLPLVALIRDPALFDPVEAWERDADHRRLDGGDAALLTRAGAAADILLWRRQVITDLEAAGVLTLDARPEDLTAALVSEYLAIKARRLL
jgi:uncharacterized protein (DUF58 family)